MDHAGGVREGNGVAHLEKQPQELGPRALVTREIIQPVAADALHHVEDPTVGKRADVVHGDDSGMLERGEDSRLAQDSQTLIVGWDRGTQDFQGDVSIQLVVVREIDGAHAPLTDPLPNFVASIAAGPLDHLAEPRERCVGELAARLRARACSSRHDYFSSCQPRRARASARNSSSVAQKARIASSTPARKVRRAHAS